MVDTNSNSTQRAQLRDKTMGAELPEDSTDRRDALDVFCELLGYTFSDISLLELALRHRSWCGENGGLASNERLEFLGDAVLQFSITQRLYGFEPMLVEGEMATRRSSLVSADALAYVGEKFMFSEVISLGVGERADNGAHKKSILSDAVEAVIGAVYLDSNIETAGALVYRLLAEKLAAVESGTDVSDAKSLLQELASKFGIGEPTYETVGHGPDHQQVFSATVAIGAEELGRGQGSSKKESEQIAAAQAINVLTEQGRITNDKS